MNIVILDDIWENFKTQVYQVGADLLGFVKKHYKDWFEDNDDNIRELLVIK